MNTDLPDQPYYITVEPVSSATIECNWTDDDCPERIVCINGVVVDGDFSPVGYNVATLMQVRFPRSKKKRIREKWANNPCNWILFVSVEEVE
jgi:hypothetical protein